VDKAPDNEIRRPAGPALTNFNPSPTPTAPGAAYAAPKGGGLKTALIIVVILVIVGLLIFGGWVLYQKYFSGSGVTTNTNGLNQNLNFNTNQEVNLNTNVNTNFNEPLVNLNTSITPLDSDADGLSDDEEAQLGTNPYSADTDGDGLTDYEEVNVYKTDPKKSDTDGDGYKDGEEVKNGYNPLGPGKLFNVNVNQ